MARGSSVTVASGNHDPAGPEVDWVTLGRVGPRSGAVVVLTGRAHQGQIAVGLVAGGRPADIEAAVVHGAGRTQQAVSTVALADVRGVGLPPPAAMVVAPSPEGGPHAHP